MLVDGAGLNCVAQVDDPGCRVLISKVLSSLLHCHLELVFLMCDESCIGAIFSSIDMAGFVNIVGLQVIFSSLVCTVSACFIKNMA